MGANQTNRRTCYCMALQKGSLTMIKPMAATALACLLTCSISWAGGGKPVVGEIPNYNYRGQADCFIYPIDRKPDSKPLFVSGGPIIMFIDGKQVKLIELNPESTEQGPVQYTAGEYSIQIPRITEKDASLYFSGQLGDSLPTEIKVTRNGETTVVKGRFHCMM